LPRRPFWFIDGRMSETLRVSGGETLLDARGLACPLPVLRAHRALRDMAGGSRLRLLTTDRASVADVRAFCRETGHELTGFSQEEGVYSFAIRRRADP
jgi:tRNA 2-thiouridine synthesizing protein A